MKSLSRAGLANVISNPSFLKIEINCIILLPAADEFGSGHTKPIIKSFFI
jgi:hypothetical protein